MKKLLFVILLFFVLTLIIFTYLAFTYFHRERVVDENRTVYIHPTNDGFQLIRNGKPFIINGACGNVNLELLAKIGANTIRIYDTTNITEILDEAHKLNLAVVVDIDIPKYSNTYNFYLDKSNTDSLKQNVENLVKKHRDHPALLMWNLGNEVNYPYVLFKKTIVNFFTKSHYRNENLFIQTFNSLIDIIHRNDPNHPVSTTFITARSKKQIASLYVNSPDLDLLSYNIFGALKNYDFYSKQLDLFFGKKPYYISEWGIDGPWLSECEVTSWMSKIEPTSTKKIEQIRERYHIIQESINGTCLGSLFFYWGLKQECTHTWFSVFDDQGSQSEIIYELSKLWGSNTIEKSAIGLDYMLLNGKGSKDNVILAPNRNMVAEVIFSQKYDNLKIVWELYQDAWYINSVDNETRPPIVIGSFESLQSTKAEFVVPEKEGPYRIFAYVYDNNGYFATTNIPFYVLKP